MAHKFRAGDKVTYTCEDGSKLIYVVDAISPFGHLTVKDGDETIDLGVDQVELVEAASDEKWRDWVIDQFLGTDEELGRLLLINYVDAKTSELRAEIAALRAEMTAAKSHNPAYPWQPIDTVPPEECVLVCGICEGVADVEIAILWQGEWKVSVHGFPTDGPTPLAYQPRYWMPCPDVPADVARDSYA